MLTEASVKHMFKPRLKVVGQMLPLSRVKYIQRLLFCKGVNCQILAWHLFSVKSPVLPVLVYIYLGTIHM